MRSQFPGWRWNGPDVPSTKPAYSGLYAGEDGRIWVAIPEPGHEVESLAYDPDEPGSYPTEWRSGMSFDVFEPDGRYLGHVRVPEEFSVYPTPIFGTEHVWAVLRDEFGVQRVGRFRIVVQEERGD
jgi:hypothetical protein